MAGPIQSKPGLRDPKPGTGNPLPATRNSTTGPYPPVPITREVACGEISLPVWETYGGPKGEARRK